VITSRFHSSHAASKTPSSRQQGGSQLSCNLSTGCITTAALHGRQQRQVRKQNASRHACRCVVMADAVLRPAGKRKRTKQMARKTCGPPHPEQLAVEPAHEPPAAGAHDEHSSSVLRRLLCLSCSVAELEVSCFRRSYVSVYQGSRSAVWLTIMGIRFLQFCTQQRASCVTRWIVSTSSWSLTTGCSSRCGMQ
jgi:hypothetical protein